MSDESNSSNEDAAKKLAEIIKEMARLSPSSYFEELMKKREEERIAKEPAIIKELFEDYLFEKTWFYMGTEDRDKLRQFIIEKKLDKQTAVDSINKLKVITEDCERNLNEFIFSRYLIRLPLILELLELEKTNAGQLAYIIEESSDFISRTDRELEYLDKLLQLQYFSLEDLIKKYKEINSGIKENFNYKMEFGDIYWLLTHNFSLLDPVRRIYEKIRYLTEDEKKKLSSFIMNKIIELSKDGATRKQMSQILEIFDGIVRKNIESEKEITDESLIESYHLSISESGTEEPLKKHRDSVMKYGKNAELIWELIKKIPYIQAQINDKDTKSRVRMKRMKEVCRSKCFEQNINYSEFAKVLHTLQRLGGRSFKFDGASKLLEKFYQVKKLVNSVGNEELLSFYMRRKASLSQLMENLNEIDDMLKLGFKIETILKTDVRGYRKTENDIGYRAGYRGVQNASENFKRLNGLPEIIGDRKYQKLLLAVQDLLNSGANLPLVSLVLAYMSMGYTRRNNLDPTNNRVEHQILHAFENENPVNFPRLLTESDKDPNEFLLYVLNNVVSEVIKLYIEKVGSKRKPRRYSLLMGDIEEKPREITFFGTNPERLSLIANKYTLRISSRPYESAVEEKEVKINEVVTASNFVSSIIPNFLNRLPQYKRNRMSLEQVLVYCEKELKQQSKLSNIMEITIKRDGLEQTVGEYVRYMIETRYNRLAG